MLTNESQQILSIQDFVSAAPFKNAGNVGNRKLDLTLTNLEGCYRELRNDFTVAVEKRDDKKFVTRWGTGARGGMKVFGRDALYFVREPFELCR